MMSRPGFILLMLLALGACHPVPEQINFDNDQRIFRGVYEAEVDRRTASEQVALSEDASLMVMGSSYQGSMTLWDVVAATPIEGVLGLGSSTDTTGVAITRDGSMVAVGFRGGVSL